MIDRLRVQNFRCLRDVDVSLGPLNFLVGPNNCGKSSFVDAARLLSRCASAKHTNEVFAGRNESLGAQGERKLRFGQTVSSGAPGLNLEYQCHFPWQTTGASGKARLFMSLGRASKPGPSPDLVMIPKELLYLVGEDGSETLVDQAFERSQSIIAGGSESKVDPTTFVVMRSALSTTPVYRLVPDRISQPCSSAAEEVRLDGDGYGLASWLDAFRNTEPEQFEQIEEILRKLVPGMRSVTFPTLLQGQKTILFHEKWGSKAYATEASDGLLLFLGYLAIAYSHGPVGTVLLEEPETGVHPTRLRDIVHLLRAMSRGEMGLPPVQVIATSHSPYLLDWCGKDEVIFFDRDDAGNVRTKPLSDVPEIDDRIEDFESLGAFIYAAGETLCKSPS